VFDTLVMTVETAGTTWPDQIVFSINGEDLRALVRDAGVSDEDMTGPPSSVVAGQPDHLLGGPDRWEDSDEPWYDVPAVLGCSCGQPGCAAVLARIEVTADEVVWSAFKRDRDKGDLRLGPFRFDRRAYEAELKKLQPRRPQLPDPRSDRNQAR